MRRWIQSLLATLVSLAVLLVLFQNCSGQGFQVKGVGDMSLASSSNSGGLGGTSGKLCTEDPTPAAAPLQRLTKNEYNNVVRDLFGLSTDFSSGFTADPLGLSGFTTEGSIQNASPDMVNDFW